MPIPVRCPECRHSFAVPDDYAGRKGKCPKCRHVFTAPKAADDVEEFPTIGESPSTPAAREGQPTPLRIPSPRRLTRETTPSAPLHSPADAPSAAAPPKAETPKAEPLEAEPLEAEPPEAVSSGTASPEAPTGEPAPPKGAPPKAAPPARRASAGSVSAPAVGASATLPAAVAMELPSAEPLDSAAPFPAPPAAEPIDLPAPRPPAARGGALPPSSESGPHPLAFDSLALETGNSSGITSATRLRRAPKKGAPLWMYVAVGACVLITGGVLAAVVAVGFSQAEPVVAEGNGDSNPAAPRGAGARGEPEGSALPSPPAAIDYDDLDRRVGPSLVLLQFRGPDGPRSALGVLVGAEGLIATSYRSLRGARGGEAVLRGEEKVFAAPLLGLVAADPRHDLALLRLAEHTEKNPRPLVIASGEVKEGETLVVVVVESNAVDFVPTQVQRRPLTNDLPGAARAEARRLEFDDLLRWIQSSRTTGAESLGLPLVNLRGELVGLNSPLGERSSAGFAVPAEPLTRLLARAGGEPLPWPAAELAAAEPREPSILPEVEAPPELSQADDLRRMLEEARAMNWYPENQQQYGTLQVFAERINELMLPEPWSDEVAVAAREVAEDINEHVWDFTESQRHALDEKADRALESPGGGLMAFARVVLPPQKPMGSDTKFCLLELLGTNRLIGLTITKNEESLRPGARVFVIGRHQPEFTIRFTENGFERVAYGVRAKFVLLQPAEE